MHEKFEGIRYKTDANTEYVVEGNPLNKLLCSNENYHDIHYCFKHVCKHQHNALCPCYRGSSMGLDE